MEEVEASSKDLLKRFAGVGSLADHAPETSGDDVELSLSLGGSFSSSSREKRKLIRSSSISAFPHFSISSRDDEVVGPANPLHRACSLPVHVSVGPSVVDAEKEEDYRKKRKRVGDDVNGFGKERAAALLPLISPGSVGSVGSTSACAGGPVIGFDITRFNNSATEAKSFAIPSRGDHKTSIKKIASNKLERKQSGPSETKKSAMEEMPYVTTRGLGPTGRKVGGFLYKYRQGETVRILCVCHGDFLTPAEFVRHAGGGDVDHPLRHIVVGSSPSPFM